MQHLKEILNVYQEYIGVSLMLLTITTALWILLSLARGCVNDDHHRQYEQERLCSEKPECSQGYIYTLQRQCICIGAK